MNPSREEQLFEMVLEKPPAERAEFLEVLCGEDEALRQRVEALLAAHNPDDSFMGGDASDKPTVRLELDNELHDEIIGSTVGHYKVLQSIGEGGCGAVYMAEQQEPVRRRVALKVIKLGMDTKAVIARFEAERQALALMDHPNIAKVLDAGSTDTGRPYFVMELVRGIKITEYCDQNKLDTKQRLELFIQICQAIQHAHQKGIIHRDIKPSNILVTLHDGIPVPKVIDFGIAKATTDQRLTDKTLFTAYEQFIGTPAYMSPEQAEMSGLGVDTRSDIYSLGVLLYELLTSKTPFDPKELMKAGVEGMRRTIREKDPARPSTRVATLQGEDLATTAACHAAEAPRLISLLRGDLDWIVMKCLEKDRTRRYETVNGLAMEIKRHLNHEPVIARPPSRLYRFRKSVRRNKVVYSAVGAVAAALVVGVVVSIWQSVRAITAERQALASRASEEQLRKEAEAQELAARQRAYASEMNVAKQALDTGNLGHALDLLERQRPTPGQRDLRGWEWRYLWQQTRSDALFTLCQKFEILSLAVSQDATWLAIGTSGLDGGVSLSVWNWATRQEIPALHLSENRENVRVAFSPVEPLLAITSASRPISGIRTFTLRLWNAASRQLVTQKTLDGNCWGLAFAEDGRTLVTATQEGHVTLWRVPDAAHLASYPCEQFVHQVGPRVGFAATADLSLAAYAQAGNRVRVIGLRDGRELWSKEAAHDFVTALAFSPDGKTLASAGGYAESAIRLWDVATGDEVGRLEEHKAWVGSLLFWPDGKKLASSSGDQTIRVWNVAERTCLDVLRGHRNEVWELELLPGGGKLVSGCKDGTVCVWDTTARHATPARITVPGFILNWCYTLNGRSILTLDRSGRVSRWDGPEFQQPTKLLDVGNDVVRSVFSDDGHYLATSATNGITSIWDVSQKVLRCQLEGEPGGVWPEQFFAQGRRLLAQSSTRNRLDVWDLTEARKLHSWFVPIGSAAAISPDSREAIVIGLRRDVFCGNLGTGGERTLSLDPVVVPSDAAYSPVGGLFAISSFAGLIQVCDSETWQEQARLGGYLQGLVSVTFSPDGRRLVSGGDAHEALRFWDTESWQDVLTLEGQGGDFWITKFSPDGNTIGSANLSGTLHLWRAPSWEEIARAEAANRKEPLP